VGRRLVPVALLGLTLTLSPSAGSSLTPPFLGAQRVLVVLATWGPQPFTRDEVQHVVFDEADAFYRQSSYGKAWLTGTVTPWLQAFDGGSPGCSLPLIRTAGAAAARTAGYDPGAYERVIYIHPSVDCPWSGVTQANTIFLDGTLSRKLVAHELGHAFGLPHANSTSCRRAGCPAVEYGDPYDTMGEGTGDFSAYAKFSLGWLTRIARPAASGVVQLEPIERPSSGPQAFVVTTARDQYWIEYRAMPQPSDRGDSPGAGLIVHVSPSPDLDRSSIDAMMNVLVDNPAGRKRPELRRGDRFGRNGAFSLTTLEAAPGKARFRFRWTDSVAPRRPRFTADVVAGKLRVTLESAADTGSGLARYRVVVDARPPQGLAGDATEEPVVVGKPLPGTHTVTVVAIDRAGNRSAPSVRHVRVQ
jgi:hypothetical protein